MPSRPATVSTVFGVCTLLALCGCEAARTRIFDIDPPAPVVVDGDGGQATAGNGQAGAGGKPAAAGSSMGAAGEHAPSLDPNASFRWIETSPGRGTCEPKRFVGNFSCDISPGLIETKLEGSIMLEFGGSSENTVFGVSKGMLTAFVLDDTRTLLQAPLTGELNCGTHAVKLELTRTQTVALPLETQVGWLQLASQLNATGQLNGTFEARGLTIRGDVALLFEPQTKCVGTFNLFASQ